MKIEQQSVYDLLIRSLEIKIPFYQRKYVWGKDEVNELLDDIIKNDDKHYYVGAIIFKVVDDGGRSWLIIDGQQRISTFWLILKVLQENEKKLEKENFSEINDLIKKFKLESKDWEQGKNLTNIVQNIDCSYTKGVYESNYYSNYEIIRRFIEDPKNKFTLDEFYEKFKRLIVARIGLDINMDEQNIYAQINSTGKELSAFDLIKNNLLHEIKSILKNQNSDKDFDKKLNFFSKLTKVYENENNNKKTNELIRHFIAYKTQNLYKTEAKTMYRGYMNMKENYYKQNGVVEALALYNDLWKFVAAYNFLKFEFKRSELEFKDKFDIIINSFGTYAVLLVDIILQNSTLVEYDCEPKFDKSQKDIIFNCFLIIENYIIRRKFCDGFNDKSLPKYMPKIVFRIKLVSKLLLEKKDLLIEIKYYHVLYYLLFIEANTKIPDAFDKNVLPPYRAPEDKEFEVGFKAKNIYDQSSENFCRLFLIKLLSDYNRKNFSSFLNSSIEHVLPQDFKSWESDGYFKPHGDGYGEEKEDVDKAKNTIGNLSLTAYNSELSNNTFKRKKEILEEKENCNFNKYIREQEKWNIKIIKERANFLYKKVMEEIWDLKKLENKEIKDSLDILKLPNIRDLKYYYKRIDNISEEKIKTILKNSLVDNVSFTKIEQDILGKDFEGKFFKRIVNYFINYDGKKPSLFKNKEKDFLNFYFTLKDSINIFLMFFGKW